jgi:putative membrane protein
MTVLLLGTDRGPHPSGILSLRGRRVTIIADGELRPLTRSVRWYSRLALSGGMALMAPAPAAAHGGNSPSWLERPDVALVLMILAVVYLSGWIRIRWRAPRVAGVWRLGAYALGIATLAVALVSPIHVHAGEALPVHMIQHMLLTMIAAPLILLGNPLPFMAWGFPRAGRRALGRLLRSRLRRAAVLATALPTAWAAAAGVLWLWHSPSAYDAALARPWLHDAQHLTFFVSAAAFWCPVIDPAPRLRRGAADTGRMAWLFAAAIQNAALAAWIALSGRVLYQHYLGPAGPAVLADQQVAGMLMLVSGTMMYVGAALLVAARLLWHDTPAARRRDLTPPCSRCRRCSCCRRFHEAPRGSA